MRFVLACAPWVFEKRVTIAFDVADDLVTVLGIFYGGQNFAAMLEESNF